jgi:hypothetical protein
MSLFQNSVLNKYLKGLDIQRVEQAWNTFTAHFHNPAIQENIRNSKEEQYQGEFLIDLFVNVLGYVKNPTPNFNLTTELKNVKGAKKTDGAILQDDKAIAVIELKGTNTVDLAKVETQAFGYKNNQPDCVYVITSNFEKLRFYIDNAVDFEEFNLFQLSKEQFDVLYLCLASENLLKGIPKQIKDESLTQEENITKKLYKDYSQFRNEIFDNIQNKNPQNDKLTLFKKTQKLLDRFLFIFFAEDRLLLPPNSIREIVNQWTTLRDELDAYVPLYDRFKKYFGYMNTGYAGKKHDIFAYNGGLFAADDILDNIKIEDELLYKHTLNLSNYDFESEVSVNILGHIFEHSLTEIENIQAQLEGTEIDKSKTKRKKDGVFYTPKYITKYIVDNTVGKLCQERKTELSIQEADYEKERKGRKKATIQKLTDQLDQYRQWLLQLTICDPACGSGAFLNQALEFLIAEHRYIDELKAKLLGDAMIFSEVQNAILENNLFGVDINEESVEIAKLSLWLRTAQKGRKLTTLNDNIKCGNSLIDDSKVAGDKAFDWHKEFPEVFANGGFDVVIGNPPYGDYFNKLEKEYLLKRYVDSFSGTFDMYIFFYQAALEIIKPKGVLCFITPNTFIDYAQFSALRNLLISENNIKQILSLTKVFDDAIVDTAIILIHKKCKQESEFLGEVYKEKLSEIDIEGLRKLDKINLDASGFILSNSGSVDIRKIIERRPQKLSDILKITQGITTGGNKCFISKKENFVQNKINEAVLHRVLKGKTINRYRILHDNDYILYSTKITKSENQAAIANFLEPYRTKLSKKRETVQGKLPWYCLHWARKESDFNEPKILIRQTADRLIGVLDTENHYPIDSIHTLNLRKESENKEKELQYLLGILNSKFVHFLYSWKLDETGKVYPQVKKVNIEWLPIPKYSSDERLSVLVKSIHKKQGLFEAFRRKYAEYIILSLRLDDVNGTLQDWHELEFGDFIKELNKAIKKTGGAKLTKSDEMEWMELFETKKSEAQALKIEIEKTDNEIDQMVYVLYGLTEDEIKMVESA